MHTNTSSWQRDRLKCLVSRRWCWVPCLRSFLPGERGGERLTVVVFSRACETHWAGQSCSVWSLLVAADIVKTVTSTPSLTDAAVLGMIVLIRTVLSISIEIEVDGVAPGRKALTTGPQVLARAARESARSDPADNA
jgi:hypothetical protein